MNRQLIDLIESFAIFGKYASQKDLVVALNGEIISMYTMYKNFSNGYYGGNIELRVSWPASINWKLVDLDYIA